VVVPIRIMLENLDFRTPSMNETYLLNSHITEVSTKTPRFRTLALVLIVLRVS